MRAKDTLIVSHIDVIGHRQRIRESRIWIATNHETLDRLIIFAKILFDPAHVPKDLPNNLIG